MAEPKCPGCIGDCTMCVLEDADNSDIVDMTFPARCMACEDYYVLNRSYFFDCPACDVKGERDIDFRFMADLHLNG